MNRDTGAFHGVLGVFRDTCLLIDEIKILMCLLMTILDSPNIDFLRVTKPSCIVK